MRTSSTPIVERPLMSLPRTHARRLIQGLFAPDQRFARAFHYYWREILGQDEATAEANTEAELVATREALLGRPHDPYLHTLCVGDRDPEPFAIFGVRDLDGHPQGRILAETIASGPLAERYGGRLGIAHCVGILDAYAGREVLERIFVSIADKAIGRGYHHLFFFTSDHRLRGVYQRFGMTFPSDLLFPDSLHLVGTFDVESLAGRRRINALRAKLARGAADAAELPRAA